MKDNPIPHDTEMAAAMLNCTPRHIRNLINKGLLTNHGSEG